MNGHNISFSGPIDFVSIGCHRPTAWAWATAGGDRKGRLTPV